LPLCNQKTLLLPFTAKLFTAIKRAESHYLQTLIPQSRVSIMRTLSGC